MFVLFDIGGTNMRVAVSSNGEDITGSKVVPTPPDYEQGILAFKQVVESLVGQDKVTGISGGIAGPVDSTKTFLANSPHISGWVNKPLKTDLEKEFGCRVILENDTVMGGIGEAVKGAGAGNKIVAYMALGTGVGGKRIVEGTISDDSFNFEPGHQIIHPDGLLCNCGGKGHLEVYVSGSYFPQLYHQKGEDIKDPQIWDEISKNLAIGLVNTVVHWTPDIVVLGGGVSRSIPLEKVERYFKQFLTIYPEPAQIVKATLGNEAGLYGALELLSTSQE